MKEKGLTDIKRKGNLYVLITDIENIKKAILNASKKKHKRKQVQQILSNIDHYAHEIQKMLISKSYVPSPYIEVIRKDGAAGKERLIAKPKFYPDQCIHWSVMQILAPEFLKGMYYHNSGSIPKRGPHYAKKYVDRWIKRDPKHTKYALQIDVAKFYPSIDHDILKEMLRKKFKDPDVLWLLESIIDSTDSGLPIGNYTSQWFANFYLQRLDHKIKQKYKVKYYSRYMDDCLMFGSNKKKLHLIRKGIEDELRRIGLRLKINWQVYKVNCRAPDYVGFRFYRDKIILRKRNARRIRRRARKVFKKLLYNYKDSCAMVSYMGWLKHSNSINFYRKNIEPFINIDSMKEVIRNESKKRNESRALCC